ncbi:hypothetical protein M9458_055775 [Cirrhinus mrigala]|uniref:Reverse transcriptase domain-containing protein n=1 Tax=Cirrhinus mrigala TaxID=683832 RepID=A0ABD0MJZ1_CIRMR
MSLEYLRVFKFKTFMMRGTTPFTCLASGIEGFVFIADIGLIPLTMHVPKQTTAVIVDHMTKKSTFPLRNNKGQSPIQKAQAPCHPTSGLGSHSERGVIQTSIKGKDAHIFQSKGTIERVLTALSKSGFYSYYFIIPKKYGSLRPILDLRYLNRALMKRHTGAPQGCVLSPLLFSLYTNDCASKDPSVKLLKFADDTTVIGLIQDGDESAYRQEVKELTVWCSHNNLELNTLKTVEMTVDFRRNPPALPPLTIMDSTVKTVETFRFLGNTISQDLKWDIHIDAIVKKAQQRLFFLRQLRKFNLPQELLKQFYTTIIESVLCTSITVWFNSATKSDLRRLHRTVRTAERIIGSTLPALQELYLSRVSKKAGKITLDPSHPAHSLFELLPSGRRYRALSTRTARHRNSFFPQAIHLMNTSQ